MSTPSSIRRVTRSIVSSARLSGERHPRHSKRRINRLLIASYFWPASSRSGSRTRSSFSSDFPLSAQSLRRAMAMASVPLLPLALEDKSRPVIWILPPALSGYRQLGCTQRGCRVLLGRPQHFLVEAPHQLGCRRVIDGPETCDDSSCARVHECA